MPVLSIYRGEHKKFKITVKRPSDDDPAVLVPQDLTGWTLTVTVRHRKGDADPPPIQKVTGVGTGIVHRDQTDEPGVADVEFDPADTADFAVDRGQLDGWADDPVHNPQVILEPMDFVVRESIRYSP